MSSKEQRQRTIAELIRAGALASQEELAERLAGLGHAVTQATISRDLEQLGAVKVRRAGQPGYALPEQVRDASSPQLARILRDWVRSMAPAGNLVVIKTPPGSAHLVGVALDQSDLPGVVGTICGDDTIFVATPTSRTAEKLIAELNTASSSLQ